MCKLDMKNAYFSVPLHQTSIKYVRFLWSGNLYEFLWLCSGLGLAPRIYKKLLKASISVLRRINIPVIIYLDSMLLMGQTMKETLCPETQPSFLYNIWVSLWTWTNQFYNFIATTKDKADSADKTETKETDRTFSFNNPSCITGAIKLPLSSLTTGSYML